MTFDIKQLYLCRLDKKVVINRERSDKVGQVIRRKKTIIEPGVYVGDCWPTWLAALGLKANSPKPLDLPNLSTYDLLTITTTYTFHTI